MRWLLVGLVLLACSPSPPADGQLQIETPAARVSGLLPLYEGPRASAEFALEKAPPRPVFLNRITVKVIDAGGREVPAPGLLSGASLQLLSATRHQELHGLKEEPQPILFVLDSSQLSFHLPAGQGIPLFSNETLVLTAQWMNDEVYRQAAEYRLKAEISYAGHVQQPVWPLALGTTWSWRSQPGESSQRTSVAALPEGEIVASYAVLGPTCSGVELVEGDSKVVLRADEATPSQAFALKGGASLSVTAHCRNPDPIERRAGAVLMFYRKESRG